MKTFKLNPASPDPIVASEIAELLRAGSVIAYPTDTFYGLGADIYNTTAIERIYSIKQRETDKPILILISDKDMLTPLIAEGYISRTAKHLIEAFWPGPLTLVFNASESIPPALTANTGKVGIRLPDNELCMKLIAILGHPITATSANISGEGNIDNPADVACSLGDKIDLLIDGGITSGIGASTVVDVSGDKPIILRKGVIPESKINAIMTEN